MKTPLISLQGVCRDYPAGEEMLTVLKEVNLDIHAGEMVAIVGTSGSGKSTLMNIIGCLDRPTRGSYRVSGQETSLLDPDELALLRREHFGFIFQRYHLLSRLTALSNVEIPAIYAGMPAADRRRRAAELLTRLNMGPRLEHKPGQLSGGQQQRVSIARALMNGGDVILADEPTGALDTASGNEVMKVLRSLNEEGHTIILVTHDREVAAHARRIVEISDGVIVSDQQTDDTPSQGRSRPQRRSESGASWSSLLGRFTEAFRMALLSMSAHRLRTLLTMLGIIIGIASVVSVVALGQGTRESILKDINAIGTNTIDVYPGKDFGDQRSGKVRTLSVGDAEALAGQPYVDTATPVLSGQQTLRYRNISVNAQVSGVGEHYFRVRGLELGHGRLFAHREVQEHAQDAVIDDNARKTLFPNHEDPLGKMVLLGTVPCRIIGVTKKSSSNMSMSDALNVWVPYTTAMSRITGQKYLRNITVRVAETVSMDTAEQSIIKLLTMRHGGIKDFFVSNLDTIRQTVEKATATLALLIASIALISLLVGGIGVMNIMLVSVTERTQEIGVRMAVGARQSDIMQQFLIEAVLVCLVGGALGIGLSLSLGLAFQLAGSTFVLVYSNVAIVSAFLCSTAIGVLFGFLPARNAARLDPVVALARE